MCPRRGRIICEQCQSSCSVARSGKKNSSSSRPGSKSLTACAARELLRPMSAANEGGTVRCSRRRERPSSSLTTSTSSWPSGYARRPNDGLRLFGRSNPGKTKLRRTGALLCSVLCRVSVLRQRSMSTTLAARAKRTAHWKLAVDALLLEPAGGLREESSKSERIALWTFSPQRLP